LRTLQDLQRFGIGVQRVYLCIPMELPPFIRELVRALAIGGDVDEDTIIAVTTRLWDSPATAGMLTAFAEIGWCDSKMVLAECDRLFVFMGGA